MRFHIPQSLLHSIFNTVSVWKTAREGCRMQESAAKNDQAPLNTCHKHNHRTLNDSCWDMLRTMKTMLRDWWRPWMRWAQSWGIYEKQLKRQGLCSLSIGLESVLALRQLPPVFLTSSHKARSSAKILRKLLDMPSAGKPMKEWLVVCAVCGNRRRSHEQ